MAPLRTLAAVVAGLFLLLASLLLAVVATDPVALKDYAAGWASDALGRRLAIDGRLRLDLVPVPLLSATGVRLANADWGSRPEMLTANRVLVEVDLPSLLRRTRVLPRVEVEGLDLSLEQARDGRANWDFDLPAEDAPGLDPPPVLIKLLTVPDARIRLSAPRLKAPLQLQLATLEQRPGPDGMLDLAVAGSANDLPLALKARAGPVASLLAGRDIHLDLNATLDQIKLEAEGHVDDVALPRDTALDFELRGPDAAVLTDRLGIAGLGRGPVALTGEVAALDDQPGIRTRLSGQVGELTVDASGRLADTTRWSPLAAEATVTGPDLALVGSLAGWHGLPAEAFQLGFSLRREADELTIETATLRLATGEEAEVRGTVAHPDRLAGNDLRFSAKGPDLARFRHLLPLPGPVAGAFDINGELQQSADGNETLKLNAGTALGNFSLAGPLGAYPEYYGSRLAWTANGRDLAALGKALGMRGWPAGAYSAQGSLDWTQPGIVLRNSSLKVGRDQLEADGLIGVQPLGQRFDLKVSLQGSDAAVLRRLLSQPGLPAGPYALTGGLRRDAAPRSPLLLNAVEARLGGARVQLDGRVADQQSRINADLKLSASGPDLAVFSQLAGQTLPRTSFSVSGRLATRGDELQITGPASLSLGGLKGQGTATLTQPVGQGPVAFDLGLRGPGLADYLPRSALSPLLARQLDLTARGTWRPGRWSLDDLRIQTGEETLHASGTLAPGADATALALNVKALTRNLAATGQRYGLRLPDEPLAFSASVSGTTAELTLSGVAAELGDSDLAGQLTLRPGRPVSLDATLTARLLDLTPWLPAAPAVAQARGDGRLIPAITLPVEWLDRLSGRLDLTVRTLRMGQDSYTDLRLQGSAGDGQLRADRVALTLPQGRLDGKLNLRPGGSAGPVVSLSGQGENIVLAKAGGVTATQNRFNATVNLTGQGRDTRALAASLNGSLRLLGTGGRMDNRLLKTMYSDFLSQLLTTLNPLARRQPFTQVVCTAYLFRAENGVLRTDPALVMRTDALDIAANGSVNLGSEAVDFSFKAAPRTGLGISLGGLLNPYVKVTGSLARPRLTLDPTGTLVNGGAAFATGGLSIVATTLWDRVVHKKDPCASAVAEADRRAGITGPDPLLSP